jgi:hypothetical protein
MQNASWAHTLAHWRYNLNDWVIDYLKQEGHATPDKIIERDSWKTKKRRKYAEKVVDQMEESGEVKRLYNDFRTEVNSARDAKVTLLYVQFGRIYWLTIIKTEHGRFR